MRTGAVVCLGVAIALTLAGARVPSAQGQAQGLTAQELNAANARRMADASAAAARSWLGNLSRPGQDAFRRWIVAVADWKKERAERPAALLAEGVLFDCLGRTLGLNTGFGSGMAVDPRFNELGLSDRLDRAAKSFDGAYEADPNLLEARFRAARIRALDGGKAAIELERLAESRVDPRLSYLAAVSRAAIAQDRGERVTAIRWYAHARDLEPGSTAVAVGLSTLDPDRPVPFDALDPDDLYYTYPCRVLTPPVATELARRVGRVASR